MNKLIFGVVVCSHVEVQCIFFPNILGYRSEYAGVPNMAAGERNAAAGVKPLTLCHSLNPRVLKGQGLKLGLELNVAFFKSDMSKSQIQTCSTFKWRLGKDPNVAVRRGSQ